MKKKRCNKPNWVPFVLFLCFSLSLQFTSVSPQSLQTDQDYEEFTSTRTFRGEGSDMPEVHCSRERSKVAWKVIEEYLMPYVEKERYQIPRTCRLHPDNDLYRDQEQHKIRLDVYEWQCGYCKKRFYEEKFLDKHFDNRHHNLLNVSHTRCLADVCGALHCDVAMGAAPLKTKCNSAAAARNKHLCEGIAHSCFPVSQGPSANRLHEFFLRQFCDALTCTGHRKAFSQGRKKRRLSTSYIVISVLTLMLLLLYYTYLYIYRSGIKRGTQELKRVSLTQSGRKKNPPSCCSSSLKVVCIRSQ